MKKLIRLLQNETIMKYRFGIMSATLALSAVFILNEIAVAQKSDGFAVQAKTQNGIIEGLYDTRTGLQTYFGIPFAKPPVGVLRWREPQPVENWKGVLSTKAFGPKPVQAIVYWLPPVVPCK